MAAGKGLISPPATPAALAMFKFMLEPNPWRLALAKERNGLAAACCLCWRSWYNSKLVS